MKYIPTFLFKPHSVKNKGCICTPDGGFLYISIKSVSFVNIQSNGEPLIKVFNTKQPIVGIDIDTQWNGEGKLFATLTSENSILIWDFEKGIAISGHKAHCRTQMVKADGVDKSYNTVLMSFMKNRNLLSMSANELVVYCVASNTICTRNNFLSTKGQQLTALKCSPYNEHHFAVGTSRGLVLVCDIKKANIIYSLRGHQSVIVSLSWNLFETPVKEELPKGCEFSSSSNRVAADNDDIFNIYDYDYLENEFGAPVKADTSHTKDADEDAREAEIPLNPNFNFQEACESLKQEINALNKDQVEEPPECDAVTLADCAETKKNYTYSSSVASVASDSTEGSLELVDHNSSSDESGHVDGNEIKLMQSASENKVDIHVEKREDDANKLQEQINEKEILLASASCDGNVYIWNTVTGSYCNRMKSPARNASNKSFMVNAVWHSCKELWTIDSLGNVIQYTITPNSSESKNTTSYICESRLIRGSKDKVLTFDIVRNSDLFWFITSEQEIILQNIKSSEIILQYATATIGISVIRESPENNSKIAFGFADRRIAVLDSSQLSQTKIVIQYLQARLYAPAKILAWSEDGCHLAYGTMEGQVGHVNVDQQKHSTFNTVSGRIIYSMVWRDDVIFFSSNDKLFAYRIGGRDSIAIHGITSSVSSATVRKEYLLLGTNRGYIDIYVDKTDASPSKSSLTFQLLQTVEVAKHYITEIAWNPLTSNQFAVAANEGCIYLLTFDATGGTASLIRKIEFGTPKAVLSAVKWSNRNSQKFITCGFDGALRVFDLNRPNGDELCFVKQFQCPLYSALLLPCDEQYALCTGKSITVEIVDVTASNNITESKKKESPLDYIKWAAKMNVNSAVTGNKKKGKILAKKAEPEKIESNELIEKIADMTIEENVNESATKEKSKNSFLKGQNLTLMQIVTMEQNKYPLEKLKEVLTLNPFKQREVVFISRLFGFKKDAHRLLADELEKVKSSTSVGELGSIFMSQVSGNSKDIILKAIQTRTLNEWHISIAPSISYSFWQKCCQAFAEQLLEDGYPLQAATFLLAPHNQLGAINMLMSANYFKEALLIARIYLPDGDPLADTIADKWIEQMESNGNLPAAALICALSKQHKRGYEILSKQRTISSEVEHVIKLLKEQSN